MQTQLHPRFKKRVPCAFEEDGEQHVGMVLNLSKRGLFVGSRAAPAVGSRVWLELSPAAGPGAEGIPARVVWKRVVHRSAANAVADGGIGLEIEGEWEAYERFFEGQVPASELSTSLGPPSHAVRVAYSGTPRTRIVEVHAASDEQAGHAALERLGEGWQVLSVAPLRPPES